MAWHSLEPRVCRRVGSSNCSRCSVSNTSHRRSASAATSDKPWEFSSATTQARYSTTSLPSRRAIFRTRPLASSRSEANATAFSASTLDTLSSASLFARAVLPYAIIACRAEVSATSTTAMRAASAAAVASRTPVTSTSNAGTSALPQDWSCRNKTREGMREHGGTYRHTSKIFFSFSD
jgi:hypothetical protein